LLRRVGGALDVQSLSKANVYSIVYRLHTAKTVETREKRMKAILAMMTEGKKFHP
jgi:uncharacterized protein YdeI (YjbR/CyaY-like superfamily)